MPPLSILIKPVSGSCNMRCHYCFYNDEMQHRDSPCTGRMTLETAKKLIDRAMEWGDGHCTFAFQGGEPTLAGLDFFRTFADCADNHPNPKKLRIHYSFQTNGLLLDEHWARWFSQRKVLVGISLDGPENIHDRCRVDWDGNGTFHRVMAAVDLLKKYQVEFNILSVVHAYSACKAKEIYQFYRNNGLDYHQYIECLDPLCEVRGSHDYSLTPTLYGAFLKDLFDVWYQDIMKGNFVYNRYFENLLMILMGQRPESCNMQGFCGPQLVIEADGSVYPCDFYVLEQWKLGTVQKNTFEEMENVRLTSEFVACSKPVPEECKNCKWLMLCRNGCRRNRGVNGYEVGGKNYFCEAYKEFLNYAYPRLTEIGRILSQPVTNQLPKISLP